MQEKAIVKKIKKPFAYVEIKKMAKCNGCKACAFGRDNTIVLPALMDTECSEGDSVMVQMPTQMPPYASLILFVIPLLLVGVGFVIGSFINEIAMFLLGFAFLAVGIFISAIVDKAVKGSRKYAAVVVETINENPIESKINNVQTSVEEITVQL